MGAIDQAVSHFKNLNDDPKVIEVEEWGEDGKPLLIYYTPFTIGERRKLLKNSQGDEMLIGIYTLIMKALDGSGENIFTLEHKKRLLDHVDSDVVARVAAEILGVGDADLGALEKN